jgi:hypothetical protein
MIVYVYACIVCTDVRRSNKWIACMVVPLRDVASGVHICTSSTLHYYHSIIDYTTCSAICHATAIDSFILLL